MTIQQFLIIRHKQYNKNLYNSYEVLRLVNKINNILRDEIKQPQYWYNNNTKSGTKHNAKLKKKH